MTNQSFSIQDISMERIVADSGLGVYVRKLRDIVHLYAPHKTPGDRSECGQGGRVLTSDPDEATCKVCLGNYWSWRHRGG